MSNKDWGAFQEELHRRYVRVKEGSDILRWGYKEKGIFSIKEAYNLKINQQGDEEGIWRKVWTVNHWPKVALFIWLVIKGIIITSENL